MSRVYLVNHAAIDIKNGTPPVTEAEKQYAAWLQDKPVPLEYDIAFST